MSIDVHRGRAKGRAGVFAAIQAAPAGPTATIGGVTTGHSKNVQGGSSFAEHSRLDREERQQWLRESQEAGDAGKGSQVTTEDSVEIKSERRRTGTQVSVEEWVTPRGNRFWELRMSVAVAQLKVHPHSELGAEGLSPSHTVESDREPARAPRPDKPSAEQDSEQIAGMMTENRNIITVSLGGRLYRALIDSGAMVSLVGAEIARRFRDKLRPSATAVRGVSGNALRVLGALRVRISIDNGSKELEVRAIEGIDHEIISGIDFCKQWELEIYQ